MKLTTEMQEVFDAIEQTNQCMFVTGKAGTGKTTLLRYIVQNTSKNVVVTAPTGIAAINCGGMTLHRMFGIPTEFIDPNAPIKGKISKTKTELLLSIDTLIIDEISMVRPDVLDYVDKKLRLFRVDTRPFGGVQVVMFGDLHQLPPVVAEEESDILFQFYQGYHFFFANVFRSSGFKIYELSQVFRQGDQKFIDILNHIRNYTLTSLDIEELDVLRDGRESKNYDNNYIHICAYKSEVNKINKTKLGEPTHVFDAVFTDNFKESSAPCPIHLQLREGARVMTLVNDSNGCYCNGSMGSVLSIGDNLITILFDSGIIADVGKYTWESKAYKMNNGKLEVTVSGTCEQFPISLAWAITIHKSQGLTFDKIIIHAGNVFASGQLYVALSRCKTMEGIITDKFISNKQIIIDNDLVLFDKAVAERGMVFDKYTYNMIVQKM